MPETFEEKYNLNCLDIESTSVNELSIPYLVSLAFPTLFTDGKRDPADKEYARQIIENLTECFASKIKYLIKFGEFENGSWDIGHITCSSKKGYLVNGSFISNTILVNIYLQLIYLNTYLMRKIHYYAKNICAINSYWH